MNDFNDIVSETKIRQDIATAMLKDLPAPTEVKENPTGAVEPTPVNPAM